MFVKNIEEPIKLKFLQALLRRLPINHPKRSLVEAEFSKCRAGYQGEQSLEFFLLLLPEEDNLIFHNLRLMNHSYFFQIDFLLLSSKFILLLEVKNIAGELFFDNDFHQLIRTIDGKSNAFDDPIIQLRNQEQHLKNWLRVMKCPDIPIESFVINANPAAIIKGSKYVATKVIRKNMLPLKVKELSLKYQVEKLSPNERRKISKLLMKYDTPLIPDLQTTYQIHNDEIMTGVHCPRCFSIPMQRKRGIWNCSACNHVSDYAHVASLQDYAMLINSTITNRALRKFLHISSNSISSKILYKMKLPYFGEGKGRVYRL